MKNRNKGIIFMPDISGFTRFVKETDMVVGQKVISRLLSSIIDSNELGFKIAEIEGDAILFYHFGKPFTVDKILKQFEKMLMAFEQECKMISEDFPKAKILSLKLVVHYGELSGYDLMGFHKLYGSTVIEAHRLLKNDIVQSCYVLLTDAYVKEAAIWHNQKRSLWNQREELCQIYDDLGRICFSYLSFDHSEIKQFDSPREAKRSNAKQVFSYSA
ncbi:DUF2652 domain-containing protein [Flavobacterium sp. ASV13]|uniref:DUF2652 domain-containing protein n=1 Tax=Flavobacterium sp. ASV13 TaxID=1506583 RepID=UPI00068A1D65|nr:DUF2652 domain-containing protein [Flavobacterium sp. ASV13]